MRRPIPARSGYMWWLIFSAFIATPAVALSVLGVRSIRAADIERDQRLRDEQAAVARLADGALEAALARAGDRGASARSDHHIPFVLEQNGVLVFPADRVYAAPFGLKPSAMVDDSPVGSVAATIDEAQAAEAQQRYGDARRAYGRLRTVSALSAWAHVRLALVDASEGRLDRLNVVSDVRLAASDARTPSGIPLAVSAAASAQGIPPRARRQFAPLIAATLASLREGRWWLSMSQRRGYDAELRGLLAASDGETTADVRLDRLVLLEATLRSAAAVARSGRVVFARTPLGDVVVSSRRAGSAESPWQGTVLVGPVVAELFDNAVGTLVRGRDFDVALRTPHGDAWGQVPEAGVWHRIPLQSVEDGELVFSESPIPAGTRAVNYGLVLLPIVLLASGLAMTAWIVRRDLALARLQATFIASVTHEFKSPITSIRLLLERLAGGRAGESTARYYTAIGSEADRLEGLVNRLLESQKIQTGQRQYVFRQTALDSLTRAVVDRLRPHADAKGMRIEVAIDPSLPPLDLDRDAITDAIGNLLDNAIKYSPPSSTIVVAVRADDSQVQVNVVDEGIGVAPADAGRIFEPFYRSRRGDEANVHGTGLGLALVKAAAEAHGGSVAVTSDGRRGSRFTLRLPVAPSDAAPGRERLPATGPPFRAH
jgi:signal transduction histidine kinase